MKCRTEAYPHNLAGLVTCQVCGKEHYVDCASVRLVVDGEIWPSADDLCDECIAQGPASASEVMRSHAKFVRGRAEARREYAEELSQKADILDQHAALLKQHAKDVRKQAAEVARQVERLGQNYLLSTTYDEELTVHMKALGKERDRLLLVAYRVLKSAQSIDDHARGWEQEAEDPEGSWASLEDLAAVSRAAREYLAHEPQLIESRAPTSDQGPHACSQGRG